MKRKSLAIDMDGVIADVEAHALQIYYERFGKLWTKEDASGKPEKDLLPDGYFRNFVLEPGFFRSAPVMDGAVEALQKLQEHYDIYIVSAAMEFPLSLPEKYDWMTEHFPFISWRNLVFCGDKSIISTDFMIDDHPKNLDHFSGQSIIFSSFHNFDINRYPRINNWEEGLILLTNPLSPLLI